MAFGIRVGDTWGHPVSLSNIHISNFQTGVEVSEQANVCIDFFEISNCDRGMSFESDLGINAMVRHNKITNCRKGIVVGKKGHAPITNMAISDLRLSKITILVRTYIFAN